MRRRSQQLRGDELHSARPRVVPSAGHGRTGTVIVNLLQTMGAAASPAEAMALLRARHASRGCRSCALLDGELEAPEQEAQAAALASQHRRGRMLQ